jgi:phenylpyruvate tautomerase PptA (4-oxalocrotonate tautomerase family)
LWGVAGGDYESKNPGKVDVMPLMHVTLTHGSFDDSGKQRLVSGLTEAACRAESVPDQPQHRMRALVLLHELSPGCFYSAGVPADAAVAGVFIDWQVSAGVLDGARKARFAAELQEVAASAADGDGDGDGDKMVVTSCVIHEVPEGQWAQNGAIRRLPDIVPLAGFEHLTFVAPG